MREDFTNDAKKKAKCLKENVLRENLNFSSFSFERKSENKNRKRI